MDEVVFLLLPVLSSLFIALLAVKFDRWLGDKKDLSSILSGLGFEIVENLSIAKTITKKAEDDRKALQTMRIPFAPMPAFSDSAYLRAKNSDAFLNYVSKNKTGVAKELIRNLHECYNSIRLVNSMLESKEKVKLEIMMQRCPKEYGEQLSATTKRTIQEAIEPILMNTLLLLEQAEPKLNKTISLLSKIPANQN